MTSTCPVCGGILPEFAGSCPACGFKVQGATQSFQPITLPDEEIAAPAEEKLPQASLRIVRGPQTGISFELNKPAMTVGRNPDCDIFLNDMTVSRQHANISLVNGTWTIHDDNSFNGVWVKNSSITDYALEAGDIVQIGAFCLQFCVE